MHQLKGKTGFWEPHPLHYSSQYGDNIVNVENSGLILQNCLVPRIAPHVVYFHQGLGAAHLKRWLK